MPYLKLLDQSYFKGYNYQYSEDYFFGPTSDINIFVGGNNTGKSRFLRGLFSQSEDVTITNKAINAFIKLGLVLDELGSLFDNRYVNFVFLSERNVDKDDKDYDLYQLLKDKGKRDWSFNRKSIENINESIKKVYTADIKTHQISNIIDDLYINSRIVHGVINRRRHSFVQEPRQNVYGNKNFKQEFEKLFPVIEKLYESKIEVIERNKIYIPNLRTVISLFDDNRNRFDQDIFESSIKVNYSFKDSEKKKVFTGLSFYSEILNTKQSYKTDRLQFEEFEKFLSKTFFDNQKIEITAISADKNDHEKVITVTFDESQERKIHLLGDGIHNLIMLVFQLFICEKDTKIYIEEPETNLHPGLERIFIKLLIENEFIQKKNLQIFFTTHSSHIINLDTFRSSNVSVFSFQKKIENKTEKFLIRNVSNPEIDILNDLGVKNSSLFLANVSIWVEGVTDRNYIKGMLNAYYDSDEFKKLRRKKYLEDLNYGFFEYAGSNISHYIFSSRKEIYKEANSKNKLAKIKAQFLANRIFLIADKDKGKSQKHSALGSFVSDNFRYYKTPGREIENLLSEEILRNVLPKMFSKVSQSDLKNISYKNYKNEYLGSYLRKVLKSKLPASFKANSGTIATHYKTRLSEFVFENIKWNQMHPSMKKLTKEIYNFIDLHNSENSF